MTDDDFSKGKEEGLILEKLNSIEKRLDGIHDSFSAFKVGIGEKVGQHQDSIVEIRTKTNIIMTVATWIFAPAFGVIVTTLLYLIIKK